VIRSFRDSETRKIFERSRSRRFSAGVQKLALRKLLMVDAAESIDDLRVPPGNRLEKLKGKREGQHSVRVNDQWRVCFKWKDGDAHEVEVVDYH
jgi:proteic killer suppression protein